MATEPRFITDATLERLPRDSGRKYEIVDGRIVAMSPATYDHERLIGRLFLVLAKFVDGNGLGEVLLSNALYDLASGHARSPDLSFIARADLPPRFLAGSRTRIITTPRLVVEVPSPSDTAEASETRVSEYLESNIPSVWIVRIDQTATLYTSAAPPRRLERGDVLSDDRILPDFVCPIGDIFL